MSLTEPSKTYKPQKYEWAVKAAEDSENLHWIHNEIDFSADIADWKNNLTIPEKNLIHQILKLFTESDKTVASMYTQNLIPYFKNNEIQQMLISFAAREGIHQRAYAVLLETLNLPDTDFEAFLEYKQMADKIDFMNDNDPKSQTGRALSLAKNIFSEGVSLFGSFIMLLNFQRFGKMKGMNTVNRWSILDEQSHVEGLAKLFNTYLEEHPRIITDDFKKALYDMARKVYELEEKFIDLAFEMGDVAGLHKNEVKQYIRYLIDRRLISMGLRGNFLVKDNPCVWFDTIMSASDHTNFFEERVVEYSKNGMSGNWADAWG